MKTPAASVSFPTKFYSWLKAVGYSYKKKDGILYVYDPVTCKWWDMTVPMRSKGVHTNV